MNDETKVNDGEYDAVAKDGVITLTPKEVTGPDWSDYEGKTPLEMPPLDHGNVSHPGYFLNGRGDVVKSTGFDKDNVQIYRDIGRFHKHKAPLVDKAEQERLMFRLKTIALIHNREAPTDDPDANYTPVINETGSHIDIKWRQVHNAFHAGLVVFRGGCGLNPEIEPILKRLYVLDQLQDN